jgi:hypothetical protein
VGKHNIVVSEILIGGHAADRKNELVAADNCSNAKLVILLTPTTEHLVSFE